MKKARPKDYRLLNFIYRILWKHQSYREDNQISGWQEVMRKDWADYNSWKEATQRNSLGMELFCTLLSSIFVLDQNMSSWRFDILVLACCGCPMVISLFLTNTLWKISTNFHVLPDHRASTSHLALGNYLSGKENSDFYNLREIPDQDHISQHKSALIKKSRITHLKDRRNKLGN